jgi:hypothetical protein
MNPGVWNCFHDGEIVSISGVIPGDLIVTIEIEYLREEFPEPGNHILLRLTQCDSLTFFCYETNQLTSGVDALHGVDLEILGAELEGKSLVVAIDVGRLTLHYQTELIELDSGRKLSPSELDDAANRAVEGWG